MESTTLLSEGKTPYTHDHNENVTEADEVLLPPDKYRLAYFILVLLGCGILVPWTTMITAVDWFSYLFPGYHFEFHLSVAYMFPNCITLILVVMYGNRFGFGVRILPGYIAFSIVFFIMPFLKGGTGAFALTIGCTVFLGIGDAILQGSLYGMAGLFPPIYTQALQVGTGVAGLLISSVRLITKASLPDNPTGLRISSMIYFIFSAVLMLTCIVGYFVLMRLEITKAALAGLKQGHDRDHIKEKEYDDGKTEWRKKSQFNFKSIFKRIWKPAIMVASNFFITLFIFPGLIAQIPSQTKSAQWDWFSVILISLFNIGDFVGKFLPKFVLRNVPELALYIITGVRSIFFPLFLLCVNPRVIKHDFFPICFVILCSISGGYIGSMAMMLGPIKVNPHEREVAGTAMSFSLLFGLTLGAVCAWTLPYFAF